MSGFDFESVALSDVGKIRTVNEDRVLDHASCGLWAVADGMGGHSAGDVAATRMIEALARVEHASSGYARLSDIVAGVEQVNAQLFGDRLGHNRAPSGTTVVALLVHDEHYACVWAGDSRAYLIRDGAISLITHDHSLVQDLVDQGLLAEDRRRFHPQAHIINRAVGSASTIELDRRFGVVAAGDIFLLCSDGLTACVEDHELAAAFHRDDLAGAAEALMATALDRQAADNISFVVVRAKPAAV
ncbi:MAG: PP2C family protein-serine/threonine phosphatase [Caulobacteraceae bacterium]